MTRDELGCNNPGCPHYQQILHHIDCSTSYLEAICLCEGDCYKCNHGTPVIEVCGSKCDKDCPMKEVD